MCSVRTQLYFGAAVLSPRAEARLGTVAGRFRSILAATKKMSCEATCEVGEYKLLGTSGTTSEQ